MCTLSASALSYASPYKGAGRNGYIYTSAPMRSSMTTHSAMAQAPVAAMSSTSAYGIQTTSHNHETKAIANDVAVRGIYTSASAIQGGGTTYDTGNRRGIGPRRIGTPPKPGDYGYCEHCHYVWSDDANAGDGGWVCDRCGCELEEGCTCGSCTCDVPLTDGKEVWLLMATLAVAYGVYKKRTSTVQ